MVLGKVRELTFGYSAQAGEPEDLVKRWGAGSDEGDADGADQYRVGRMGRASVCVSHPPKIPNGTTSVKSQVSKTATPGAPGCPSALPPETLLYRARSLLHRLQLSGG